MPKRQNSLQQAIADQIAWIRRCGGDLAGYIANYGPRRDAMGEDGTAYARAVYSADLGELQRLKGTAR